MAGMWGCKRLDYADLNIIYDDLISFCRGDEYHNDQYGLKNIHSKISFLFLEHDDFKRGSGIKFPQHKPFKYGSFIGERITADNQVGPIERW